jgi:hypothetical protein
MMKTGHVEKTSDREYEVEERRYRTLESASLRLQKEAKGYLDSLRAMTASQMRIAETIDAFYGDSGATDGVSRSYKQAVEDLDAETVKALDGPYRCVTQDPETFGNLLFDEEMGLYDTKVLAEVESELNFQAGNRRNYTRHLVLEEMQRADQLIEFVYRTTVLEPINRFCAYFPDINECEWNPQPMMWTIADLFQASKSGTTKCSTTIPCEAKLRGWWRNQTKIPPSFRAPKRRLKW